MTLTIVKEKTIPLGGGLKQVIFKVTDSDGSGGTLEMSPYLNHIYNAHVQNITTAVFVSAIWTDGDETITIGAESTAADTLKVTVTGT